jgi:hypothetical protein
MAFQARYVGHCAAECGNPIVPGDMVRYDDDQIVHDSCVPRVERPKEICPKCWMERPCVHDEEW